VTASEPGPAAGRARLTVRPRPAATWRGLAVSVLLGLAIATGACRPANPGEDGRIESEIKARLVAETTANLTRLGVLSSKGVVYLSGTVESADAKERAEALARGVRGVGRVVNALEVRPE
jgi:hypothetical protein